MLNISPTSFALKILTISYFYSLSAVAHEVHSVDVSQCEIVKEIAENKLQTSNLSIASLGVSETDIKRNIQKGLVTADIAHAALEMKIPLHEHAITLYKEQCAGAAQLASLVSRNSKI
ncbi:MAG: hypothetical protein ACPGTQ_09050 [Colwellia sp.]